MRVVFRTPVTHKIIEAIHKNQRDLGEHRIEHFEVTPEEFDEILDSMGSLYIQHPTLPGCWTIPREMLYRGHKVREVK